MKLISGFDKNNVKIVINLINVTHIYPCCGENCEYILFNLQNKKKILLKSDESILKIINEMVINE